jgi:hypothetical protein
MELTPAIFAERAANPFNIVSGQMRSYDFVHNGGWYNKKGQKLGWGDLSPDSFADIAQHLPADEVFIVLPESASHWDFVKFTETHMVVDATAENPGPTYCAEKASYFVHGGVVYKVISKYDSKAKAGEQENMSMGRQSTPMWITWQTREFLAALLKG